MEQIRNYTGYGVQGSNYNSKLSLKDIAKLIRGQLKKEFPTCKFSVVTEYYSMGCSLHVSLMESPFKVSKDENFNGHLQLNEYQFINESEVERQINNGYKITPQLFYIMNKVVYIINSYNYNDSDPQIDYFDTNFYLHLNVGKWDKPYRQIN